MPTCSVSGCSEEGNNKFPKVGPLRREWLEALGGDHLTSNSAAGAVCDRHFCDSDFMIIKSSDDDFVHKILQPSAVPILHLSPHHGNEMLLPVKEEDIGSYTYEDSYTLNKSIPEKAGIISGLTEATSDGLILDPLRNQKRPFCLESHNGSTEPSPFTENNLEQISGQFWLNPGKSTHPPGRPNSILKIDSDRKYFSGNGDPVCNLTNSQKSVMLTQAGESSCDSEQCRTKLTQSGNVKSHTLTLSGKKPYICEQCGVRFTESGNLQTHMRTHSGEKPYKCEPCGAMFTQSGNLKRHIQTHLGEKPYKCEQCGARFTVSGSLKKHMRIHSGEKPYKCEQCGAMFTQSENLNSHVLTHSGNKPYNCEQCGAMFTRSWNLKSHMLTHSGKNPYKCEQCGAKFFRNKSLKTHMLTH